MALEEIDDTDAEALQLIATKANLDALKAGTADPQVALAAKRVDRLIADSPGLSADKILYRGLSGDSSKIRGGVALKDTGYTVLTEAKPTADTVLAIKLRAGTKVLEIDGTYLLPRGLTLELKPTPEGDIPAVLQNQVGSLTAAVKPIGIVFNAPQGDALEEFYNHAHGKGGKFAPGGGSSSGGSGTKGGTSSGTKTHSPRNVRRKQANHAKGKRIAKDVATGLAYIGIIAGTSLILAKTGLTTSTGTPSSRNAVRENNARTTRQHAGKKREESPHDWYERTLREKPIIR